MFSVAAVSGSCRSRGFCLRGGGVREARKSSITCPASSLSLSSSLSSYLAHQLPQQRVLVAAGREEVCNLLVRHSFLPEHPGIVVTRDTRHVTRDTRHLSRWSWSLGGSSSTVSAKVSTTLSISWRSSGSCLLQYRGTVSSS